MLMDIWNLFIEIDLFYIISQLFALIGLILSLISQQQRKKISILKFKTASAASAAFQYLFLGA